MYVISDLLQNWNIYSDVCGPFAYKFLLKLIKDYKQLSHKLSMNFVHSSTFIKHHELSVATNIA